MHTTNIICWLHPPVNFLKLNTDGSCVSKVQLAAGGLIRNRKRWWLIGFSKYIGCGVSLLAELWGMYEGLLLAWRYVTIVFWQNTTHCNLLINWRIWYLVTIPIELRYNHVRISLIAIGSAMFNIFIGRLTRCWLSNWFGSESILGHAVLFCWTCIYYSYLSCRLYIYTVLSWYNFVLQAQPPSDTKRKRSNILDAWSNGQLSGIKPLWHLMQGPSFPTCPMAMMQHNSLTGSIMMPPDGLIYGNRLP